MNTVIVYADSAGIIQKVVSCPADGVSLQTTPSGLTAFTLPDGTIFTPDLAMTNYIASGTLTPRTAMPLTTNKTAFTANGTDEVTITGIPTGASATITGAVKAGPETITDGELIITSTAAGKINVSITLRPAYQDWSATLNAN